MDNLRSEWETCNLNEIGKNDLLCTILYNMPSPIEDRKNAEIELKKSEEKYQKLVDTSPDAIVIHEDGKITFANHQAIKLFEAKCEEDLIGKAISDLIAPSLRDVVLERIKHQELHNENQELIEEQILTLKGNIIDVEVKAALIEQTPKKIFQTVLRDISERKIIEDELRQKNNKLEEIIKELERTQMKLIQQEKMAGIGQLAAGVAHEINNPLGFVLSNFEILKKYKSKYKDIINAYNQLKNICVTGSKEEIQSKLGNISELERKHNMDFIDYDLDELLAESTEGLERISKIVRGLSLFSRMDQSEEFVEYDLNMAIENTLLIVSNEIKYHANIDKKLGELPILNGLGSQINQVILNLIVNAAYAVKVKGSETMGVISIRTYAIDAYVYCEISDTGIGIPKEKIDRIFEPFFTTKPPGEGTGLGLSISYDIIKNKYKGDIKVESEEGVGTKFIIKLPVGKLSVSDK
ncbi:MAG: sensor histidine kinase [Bacillota bacterium]